jgi:hypothetical protein
MAAGAGAIEAQSVGVGPEVGKLRLAVMDLNGSALRIQQTQGQVAQGGGVQTTMTVNLPPPPEFARTLTEHGQWLHGERRDRQAGLRPLSQMVWVGQPGARGRRR